MIFPGFPGVLSFFQVDWEPCRSEILLLIKFEAFKGASIYKQNLQQFLPVH